MMLDGTVKTGGVNTITSSGCVSDVDTMDLMEMTLIDEERVTK